MGSMAEILKSCGCNQTSLDMSMILFDKIIEMLNRTMFRMHIKLIPFGFQRMNYTDDITKWYPIIAMYNSKEKQWDGEPYHPAGNSDYSELSEYKMKFTIPKEMTVAATGTEKERIHQNEKVIQVSTSNVQGFINELNRTPEKVMNRLCVKV